MNIKFLILNSIFVASFSAHAQDASTYPQVMKYFEERGYSSYTRRELASALTIAGVSVEKASMMYEQISLSLKDLDYITKTDLTKTALITGASSWQVADVYGEISELLRKSKSSNFYVAKELAKVAILARVSTAEVATAYDQMKSSLDKGTFDYLTPVELVRAKFRITESALPALPVR